MSMLKALACPSRRDARALPLRETVELLDPVVVKANDPVGFGGFRTSRASRRISAPNLKVCLPRTMVKVSRYSVTEVVKLELAAVVGPICSRPVTVKIGMTDAKELAGRPGIAMPPFCSEF